MALTIEQRQQQMKQAEELLFSGPQTLGFAKGLYFGHFNADVMFPYPALDAADQSDIDAKVAQVQRFCEERIDAAKIDREARKGKPIPSDHAPLVIDIDEQGHPFDAGWTSAAGRIAARRAGAG